jgi:hypothetical protein
MRSHVLAARAVLLDSHREDGPRPDRHRGSAAPQEVVQ